MKGDGSIDGGLDFVAPKVKLPDGVATALRAGRLRRAGDRLVAFGWAMAEDLAAGKLGR